MHFFSENQVKQFNKPKVQEILENLPTVESLPVLPHDWVMEFDGATKKEKTSNKNNHYNRIMLMRRIGVGERASKRPSEKLKEKLESKNIISTLIYSYSGLCLEEWAKQGKFVTVDLSFLDLFQVYSPWPPLLADLHHTQ